MTTKHLARSAEPDVAEVAALIGDPGRAAMLLALFDGGELTASDLALRGGMTPQAATAHLKKLIVAGLLAGRAQGRHRFFRLTSPDVAHAIEALTAIAKPARITALDQSRSLERMRLARTCYDHLAGRLGVAVTEHLVERGAIEPAGADFLLGRHGRRIFSSLEIDVEAVRAHRRRFARACVDWTERRAHLAGGLGASVLDCFLRNRWVARNATDRALRITPEGARQLAARFGFEW
ncbi:MAG TPA: helix-turn-helix transcriptional regulator [Alphaproteobacteria bacterium]|nr:helix-turn-helix transcriptional regulator [Alphaproteobacteria bacterium]